MAKYVNLLTGLIFCIVCHGAQALTIGFNSDTGDVDGRYKEFVGFLNDRLGVQHKIKIASTYEEASSQLLDGDVDITILSPLNYVKTTRKGDIFLLGAIEKNNGRHYGSVLLSNAKNITSIKEIEDSTFFYPSVSSMSGYLLPLELLKNKGVDIDRMKKQHVNGGHVEAMKAAKSFKGEAIVATSTERYYRKEDNRFVPRKEFYSLYESAKEIPFDAIVIRTNLPPKVQTLYRRAIGELITMSWEDFTSVFPPEKINITSIWYAKDSDFDVIRRIDAQINGEGWIRYGASKQMDPVTIVEKRRNFREYQRILYDQYNVFVDIVDIYDDKQSDEMIADLANDKIDIGAFAPLQAGRAIDAGLDYIGIPTWLNGSIKSSYLTHVIRKKGPEFAFNYEKDIYIKKIAAIGPPKTIVSASGYAYVFHYLEKRRTLDEDNIRWFDNEFEIVEAVSKSNGDTVGIISEFRLKRMQSENDMANDVEVVEASRLNIPSGAYIVSKSMSEAFTATPQDKARFQDKLWDAAQSVKEPMHPGFSPMTILDAEMLVDVYRYVYPKDYRSHWAIFVAGFLTILAGIVFMIFYRDDAEQA